MKDYVTYNTLRAFIVANQSGSDPLKLLLCKSLTIPKFTNRCELMLTLGNWYHIQEPVWYSRPLFQGLLSWVHGLKTIIEFLCNGLELKRPKLDYLQGLSSENLLSFQKRSARSNSLISLTLWINITPSALPTFQHIVSHKPHTCYNGGFQA